MSKRILALLLCAIMLIPCFSGCSEKLEQGDLGAYITMYLTDKIYDFDPANAYYALYLVVFRAFGGCHNYRNIGKSGTAFHPFQQFHSVRSGKHHIKDHKFRHFGFECIPEIASGFKASCFISLRFQRIDFDIPNTRVVLHTPDHVCTKG